MSDEEERQRLIARAEKLQRDTAALQDRISDMAASQPQRSASFPVRELVEYGGAVLTASVALIWLPWPFAIVAGVFGYAVLVNLPALPTGPGGGGAAAGTRSWEAAMTVDLLNNAIAAKEAERDGLEGEALERLRREIVFLVEQRNTQQMIADSGDSSPGKGYIAFETYPGD